MYHVPATQARLHHYRSKPLNCVFMFSVDLPQLKFYIELYFVWSLGHFKSSDSQCQYLNAEMPLQHRRQSDSPWYCQPCPDYSITLICKFVVPCHVLLSFAVHNHANIDLCCLVAKMTNMRYDLTDLSRIWILVFIFDQSNWAAGTCVTPLANDCDYYRRNQTHLPGNVWSN